LTHSLEVSQIARSVARVLKLNEDLCEVISLAHDLGHTPFGHAGETALSSCLNGDVFDHNVQSLRILILLEDTYNDQKGLNLSLNCIDGLLKHNGPLNNCDVIKNQLPEIFDYGISFKNSGSLEAQISSLSDDIAYNCHDIDDGLRAELFDIEDLFELKYLKKVFNNKNKINKKEIVRKLLNMLVTDLIENSRDKINAEKIKNIDDVYNRNFNIINFSNDVIIGLDEIRNFLKIKMYNHNSIKKWNTNSEEIIKQLFLYFKNNIKKIPNFNKNFSEDRNIADYISGMTDKFALNVYNSIK
jgi:dGTPase